jgi:hypothetical protein
VPEIGRMGRWEKYIFRDNIFAGILDIGPWKKLFTRSEKLRLV